MDMARVLIIKTPQKYKKTTHSARISALFCVYFLRLFLRLLDLVRFGWDGGMSGMEEKKSRLRRKKTTPAGFQAWQGHYMPKTCRYLWGD